MRDDQEGSSAPTPDRAGEGEPDARETGTPRWVVVFGVVALVFVAAFVAIHLAGGGFRGHGGP